MDTVDKIKNYRIAVLIFTLALVLRLAAIFCYVHLFDRYENYPSSFKENSSPNHAMIKGDGLKYYQEARYIIKEVRTKKNWVAVRDPNLGPFLYPRLIALYGLITGKIAVNEDNLPLTSQITGFLILQALVSALCIALFFIALAKQIPVRVAVFSAVFLAIEPGLVQYTARLWTESLFISLLLLSIIAWLYAARIDLRQHPWRFILAWSAFGILLGIDYLQRPVALLLPLVFAVVMLIGINRTRLYTVIFSIILFMSFYAIVLSGKGFYNLQATGLFYTISLEGRTDLRDYVACDILATAHHSSSEYEANVLRQRTFEEALGKGLINDDGVVTLQEYSQMARIAQAQAVTEIVQHPMAAALVLGREFTKSFAINPFDTYFHYAHIYKPQDRALMQIQTRQLWGLAPAIIIYSLIILIPAAVGFFFMNRDAQGQMRSLHWLFMLLVIYFFAITGSYGDPRYTISNIIAYSFYGAYFLNIKKRRQ